MKTLCFFLLAGILIACQSSTQEQKQKQTTQESKENKTKTNPHNYLELGEKITTATQAALLKIVSQAIAQKGTHGAVEYCNIKALSIIDSLSKMHKCQIRRISDKYRNPQDKPQNTVEEKGLQTFLEKHQKQEQLVHFTLQEDNNIYYFKPIMISMETCLKCHGTEKDINERTLHTINQLYPNDLAKGYRLRAFRGAWVVRFQAK
ncbi:MAG: DUF3365 domain-containing protein [Microscillaceae bacterium]|nr:DUF3365 domain-containing protein [Microscillaceae bacterium]MDW8461556.1 DUF3365 domain-containing protein [Cytophagales bacterium]